ncbi:MAG: UPF0280 family protein [Spirochaetes bacterium]|nr:UPF0280 family protein [Spirochaetota bacterium]
MNNYSERFYRDFSASGRWTTFRVKVESTDLYVRAARDLSERTRSIVERVRAELRAHIARQDVFLSSFTPVAAMEDVPEVVRRMYRASERAGVGPMAAVAGAIAELVGTELAAESDELIIENGGDIWMRVREPVTMGIFAGYSKFSGRLAVRIHPRKTPLGACCSSGKHGHSTSLGRADAVTVFSPDAALADAVATEACNRVRREEDLPLALEYALGIPGITGVLAVMGDSLAVRGDVELREYGAH